MTTPTERARALAKEARASAENDAFHGHDADDARVTLVNAASVLEEMAAENDRLSAVIDAERGKSERERARLIDHGNTMIAEARRERDEARAALREWECAYCSAAEPGKMLGIKDHKWEVLPCHCGGTRLSPVARAALGEEAKR